MCTFSSQPSAKRKACIDNRNKSPCASLQHATCTTRARAHQRQCVLVAKATHGVCEKSTLAHMHLPRRGSTQKYVHKYVWRASACRVCGRRNEACKEQHRSPAHRASRLKGALSISERSGSARARSLPLPLSCPTVRRAARTPPPPWQTAREHTRLSNAPPATERQMRARTPERYRTRAAAFSLKPLHCASL